MFFVWTDLLSCIGDWLNSFAHGEDGGVWLCGLNALPSHTVQRTRKVVLAELVLVTQQGTLL